MLLYILCYLVGPVQLKKLADVYWNSTNSFLGETACTNSNDTGSGGSFTRQESATADSSVVQRIEQYVSIGDAMDIICPFYDPDVDFMNTEQSIIFRVSRSDYESCFLSPTAKELGRCTSPMKRDKVKVSFRLLSPNPSALDYRPGQTYYFITTSTGTPWGLNNTKGGLCSTHQLKMIIHVGHIRYYHHRHHKKPKTTTESPTEKAEWPAEPLWTNIFQKVETVGNIIWSTLTRGERLTQRFEYESLPIRGEMDFQIHEIGDIESLFMSSTPAVSIMSLWILLTNAVLMGSY